MAYGAKLPPGGGGGKYGRIVSGSYDETIIIWRRDKEGVWKAQHTLRQEDAAAAASREFENREPPREDGDSNTDISTGLSDAQPAPGSQAYFHNLINQIVPHGPHALRQALTQYPQLIQYPHLQTAIAAESTPQIRNTLRSVVAAALARQQILLAQQLQAAGQGQMGAHATQMPVAIAPAGQSTATHTNSIPVNLQPVVFTSTGASQSAPTANQADTVTAPAHAPPPPPATQLHPHLVPASMARVFKLQFDARRIICCSQTAVIVGWDFANNDEKIIEASQFYAPIE
jgi:F-box and WD-40 domain protein 1/11